MLLKLAVLILAVSCFASGLPKWQQENALAELQLKLKQQAQVIKDDATKLMDKAAPGHTGQSFVGRSLLAATTPGAK